ncbi:Uncharacterized [Syntrophomonas zehnderi OL-4]|uniref:Uncharacterized n=1 Tax=Syntrophomonas zehnderi OL-4 TaxID=690567 RepID=A0A0E3W2R1_9FIRM|nr:hypothetical protein [Syntrophomonas zehnderi]CFX15310.1 Uncharacterized [Syntrophomonas zehnderi OL-4]
MRIHFKRLFGNNRGNAFLENLLMILLVVMIIAVPALALSQAISDIIVATVGRVNRIGTP